jgi:HSP20 family molecular chaperone IbpA
MMLRAFFRATCLFAGLTFSSKGTVRAHRWGDNKIRCSERSFSNSCDFGTRCHREFSSSTFPRRYQYHRENGPYHGSYNRGRQRCTSAMNRVSKIFPTSCYSDFGGNTNSFLRQHRNRVNTMNNIMELPFSFENYGDTGIELSMELPGVDAKDVSLELHGDTVVISVCRRLHQSSSIASEAEFSQSFQLGKDVDLDGIHAILSSGILIISAPRKPPVRNHHHQTIPIQTFDQNEEQDKEAATKENNTSTEEKPKTLNGHHATESQPPKNDDDDFEILDEEDTWE